MGDPPGPPAIGAARLCERCERRRAEFRLPGPADPLAFLTAPDEESPAAPEPPPWEWLCLPCVAELFFGAKAEDADELLHDVARRAAARRLIDSSFPANEGNTKPDYPL
jgi:hypothetical protein